MLLRLRLFFAPLLIASLLVVILSAGRTEANVVADPSDGRPEQVALTTTPSDGAALLAGLGADYLSPVQATAKPFTHMLLRWEAVVPEGGHVHVEVRAGLDGVNWTPWGEVVENPDLWMPSDGDHVFWSEDIYAGEGMQFWQVRAVMEPAPDGALPRLDRIEVNTVDARFGPTNPLPTFDLQSSVAGFSKPAVVSRTSWGNPDGQGSRARPAHYPVTHMVVHHTADANSLGGSQQSWADRVRAIWSFHTYTRDWGDVGYNYLIDPNGMIYEGRAGGDDAVGFHDTANYGSMGVVIIGTYSSVEPPAAALNSAVDLLTWKTAQKRINPLGQAFYYGCSISKYCKPFTPGSIVETISGHRQVTPGRTTCPGDKLQDRVPELRQRVAARLAGQPDAVAPDNGDLIIDDLERSFGRSSANWYGACGYGGSSIYTFATDNPAESSNSAVWTPNIPSDGQYRVLVHIPQGCDQGMPTSQARYRVRSADGEHEVVVDQHARRGWVELGSFRFTAGTNGSVQLSDLTGEPLSANRVVYVDAVQFVKEDGARIELLAVQAARTSVAVGDVLKVTFTVRNSGTAPAETQDPQAGTLSDSQGSYDSTNGYVYDEGECFLGAPDQDYPSFPKQAGTFRLTLGPVNRTVPCGGEYGGYPWRWGLNGPLAPGETRDVIGYVRFREPGEVQLQAGVIREYVAYLAQNVALPAITVTPEQQAPAPAAFNANLQPLAHVYQLGHMPDNLLARTQNPLSIVKGDLLGSFVWNGELQDWGNGGPLPGLSDGFVIEQTRVFAAPVDGEYTFEVTSDDGAWLWVNGRPVVVNGGLHYAQAVTGTISLPAGRHVLGFKYFERGGSAVAGYAVRTPGATGFTPLVDGLAGSGSEIDLRIGNGFRRLRGLTLAADDMGGSGTALVRASFDGVTWYDLPGGVVNMGEMAPGEYHLRYKAVDAAGNESPMTDLRFRVDPSIEEYQVFLPLLDK